MIARAMSPDQNDPDRNSVSHFLPPSYFSQKQCNADGLLKGSK